MLQPEIAPAGARTNRWTTLLADDVPDLRFVLKLALQRSGRFDVIAEADNGFQAIELATTHRPQLVLLDLYMPRMDGLEALPRIRELLPDSKVVVFSGMAEVFSESVLAAGASGVIVKGVATSELIQRLTDIVSAH
ncbi:MAG: response regulator [Actinomycetota bacterium]